MEIIGFTVSIAAIAISCMVVWYCRSELSKMANQTQNALNTMSQQQTELMEEMAKYQGVAIQSVIDTQSKTNKNHKQVIEKLVETQKWHSQLLHFQDNESLPVINLNFAKDSNIAVSGEPLE